jgi:hypothetical protein
MLPIVERQNHLLQTLVERVGLVNLIIVVADRPSGDTFVPSLNPLPVEDTEARDAIERRLHATCT